MTNYLKHLIGKELEMLIETFQDEFVVGHAENYVKCYLTANNEDLNTLRTVEVVGLHKDGVIVKPAL